MHPFDRYPPPLRVRCPLCGALPPQPCRSRRGGRSDVPHKARVTAAAPALSPRALRRRERRAGR